MTSSIRILTKFTVDSSPALLLVSPNGDTTLVNCGEGCQRSFLETTGLRTRSITRVCLTHIGHDAIGGLGGMVLTTADVAIAAAASQAVAGNNQAESPPSKRKATENDQDLPGIDIVGPNGTKAFLHSLRHFMRRDAFRIRVSEGSYRQIPGEATTRNRNSKERKSTDVEQGFYVETIPLVHQWSRTSASGSKIETQVLSFVFTTPPVPGKFLPDKARELGIPPGPLYARLKMGESVTFVDKEGLERMVESHQVVQKGSPAVAVAVVYCPSVNVFEQLRESLAWESLRQGGCGPDSPELDVMVHMTSRVLFRSEEYRQWMAIFPRDVEHIWLESAEFLTDLDGNYFSEARKNVSPFRAAATGALTRSLLSSDVFPSPVSPSSGVAEALLSSSTEKNEQDLNFTEAVPGVEYKIIPRQKKGFVSIYTEAIDAEREEALSVAAESGALELAKTIIDHATGKKKRLNQSNEMGELIFTGTGSAIPCKQRNVTGMYLRMKNENAMLLDAGEGTFGQLLRAKHGSTDFRRLLQGIKAVWISHPHADHHLGLLRLLSERNTLLGYGKDPLVLIAPPNMFAFLREYSEVDPSTAGSYLPLDCRDLDRKVQRNPFGERLLQDLSITQVISVPVAHCPYSYAVIIDGTPFGRVAYSGDCRPSNAFADAAIDTDLLIHESTFEDGMEEEAVLKRHCTVGEALGIGRRMRAKAVVLTHFSQRYPRIPPLRQFEKGVKHCSDQVARSGALNQPLVVFAFDFMKLKPDTVAVASALTPALRLLYPCEEEESGNGPQEEVNEHQGTEASKVLAVPGLFAQKDFL